MDKKIATLSTLMLVALIVVGIGFYQYIGGGEEPIEETPDTTYPAISPEDVVRNFYTWYMRGDSLEGDDAYMHLEALTGELIERLEKEFFSAEDRSYDPFFCTSGTPESIAVRSGTITGNVARVPVDLSGEESISFLVELVIEGGVWKIHTIVCFEKG